MYNWWSVSELLSRFFCLSEEAKLTNSLSFFIEREIRCPGELKAMYFENQMAITLNWIFSVAMALLSVKVFHQLFIKVSIYTSLMSDTSTFLTIFPVFFSYFSLPYYNFSDYVFLCYFLPHLFLTYSLFCCSFILGAFFMFGPCSIAMCSTYNPPKSLWIFLFYNNNNIKD